MKQKAVIFDLDGTLADISHRLHFIKRPKKLWNDFFLAAGDDKVIEEAADLFRLFGQQDYVLIIVTGRSDVASAITTKWLSSHGLSPDYLFMRKDGDFRHDYEIKRDIYNDLILDLLDREDCRLTVIFEDRSRVVSMWRDLGLNCYQVNDGNF